MTAFSMLCAAALLASPAAQPSPDTIAGLDHQLWQAAKDHKMDAFRALLADGYEAIYGKRVDAVADAASTAKMDIQSFKIEDMSVRVLDADTAVTTYKVVLSAHLGDRDLSGDYWGSSVWHRFGASWRAVLHSEARVPPPQK